MTQPTPIWRRPLLLLGGVLALITVLAPLVGVYTAGLAQDAPAELLASAQFGGPTTSSPITMSDDEQFIWVVNPDDSSVSVLGNLDTTPSVLRTIRNVGREPQAVALDITNHAYVVSPPDNGVKVIDITSANPASFNAVPRAGFLTTGAEPWNLVASPDGNRIFVANAGQDTITVIRTDNQTIVGSVDLRTSLCNVDDQNRHFQPRGLAVTEDGTRLYVARFLSFTKPGGVQADDLGKEGVVCQLTIPASITQLPTVANVVRIDPMLTGFNNPQGNPTSAYPNQLQSIVIRDNQAYLPNIAASPSGPLRFNIDTQAFVNVIDNASSGTPVDAPDKSINMHLGARDPEPGKDKLFFANPWAIAFTTPSGAGDAYAVSAGSDLLVKLNVDATGALTFTGDISTTTYINLNDPQNPTTSGRNAGKNPLGIVIRGDRAFVMNYISRNVSVVDLLNDEVERVVVTTALPPPDSFDEQLLVGKEIFFSSRGVFDGGKVNRLSSEGWQNCASCHFAGLTDGNIWAFGAGPRKSVPMNGTWSPHNPDDQRLLNYSAIFDEVQDFELNIRNVSGPGPLAAGPPPVLDPNHGLIISDTGNIDAAPAVVAPFLPIANAGRPQLTVTLPGSNKPWPALDAMKEWVRFAIRTPEGKLTTDQLPGGNQTGGLGPADVVAGRRLFFRAGCHECHGGTKWTNSSKDFTSPPAAGRVATEAGAAGVVGAQFMPEFLRNINSFGLGTLDNPIGLNVGGAEKTDGGLTALGKDHNNDGKGEGFNTPSMLGIYMLQPYYHNGACETLACVVSNQDHRTGNGQFPDVLASPADQAKLVAWLQTLDAETEFPLNLSIRRHDIFFDPPRINRGSPVVVGANLSLFGTLPDLEDLLSDLGQSSIKVNLTFNFAGGDPPGLVEFNVTPDKFGKDFGQAVITTTIDIPANTTASNGTFTFVIDPDQRIPEANENDNEATRSGRLRNPPPDRTPPTVDDARISDEDPFNDTDAIAQSTDVFVKIRASDPPGIGTPTGVTSFCIVNYTFNVAGRFWEPSNCTFEPLPAPEEDGSYIVEQNIPAFGGVVYAFVWVRDGAGNISRQPRFAFISYVPQAPFRLNRNDVRIFRIPLQPGQEQVLSFTPVIGDVDVAVFDDFRNPNATRIALSAKNGPLCEQVTLTGIPGGDNRFQVEVRAIVNSLVQIGLDPCPGGAVSAAASAPEGVHAAPDAPIVAGPPLRAAIEDEGEDTANLIFLPVVVSRSQ
jgi:DNA-binding beta-propeller fold protein YncE/mono/diheme cytochrome c family protein